MLFTLSYDPEVDMFAAQVGRKWSKGRLLTFNLPHGINIDVDTKGRFRGVEIFDASTHFKPDELAAIAGGRSWLTVAQAVAECGRQGEQLSARRIRELARQGLIEAKRDGRRYLIAGHSLWNYLETRPDAPWVRSADVVAGKQRLEFAKNLATMDRRRG